MEMTQDEVDKYCESVPAINIATRGVIRLNEGVGLNDLPHATRFIDEQGKIRTHSGYRQWSDMLIRCYSEKSRFRHPTYADVTVCDEWLKASNFVAWQKTQYREEGWQLDKDLLVVRNKVYSPETCMYIPRWLNVFTSDGGAARGKYLIGVSYHKISKKLVAQCRNPVSGRTEYLGLFEDEMEAHLAWRKRKLEHALTLKPEMDAIDLRIYPNVLIIIKFAR